MGFAFKQHAACPGGRFARWAEPEPGQYYALGVDCALGIEGKDRDAAILFNTRREQVASLHGHWGEMFPKRIRQVVDHYGADRVLIVVEAAKEGILVARSLYDHGYWLYGHRQTETKGRNERDRLGHVPTQWDPSVQLLRVHLADDKLTLRDPELHGQLSKFGFRARSRAADPDTTFKAEQLTWGAPAGEHDDLVRACALANWGIDKLPTMDKPKPKVPHNSIAARIDHNTEDEPKDDSDYWNG